MKARVEPHATPAQDLPARSEDLTLARAAVRGEASAVAQVYELLRAESNRAARRFHLSPSAADELTQTLAERLLMGPERSPLARTYSGAGSLRMWLRTLALRAAALHPELRERNVTEAEALLERMITSGRVDVTLLKAQQAARVKAAVQAALGALTVHERTVLRLQLLCGWSMDAIATRYQVHRATAARWMQRTRTKLLADIEAELGGRGQLSPEEIRSVIRLLRSEVELSLERLLDSGTTGAGESSNER